MTGQRWKQVRDLFDAALEQPPGQRESYLTAQCAGDAELAGEVRALLTSFEESDHLITQPAIRGLEDLLGGGGGVRVPSPPPPPPPAPPVRPVPADTTTTTTTRIRPVTTAGTSSSLQMGYYRVFGKLGPEPVAGAPSVLLLAGDVRHPEQPVALRVFRGGLAASRILPRFQRERSVLTALEHPLIARLLDAGASAEGMPYVVLEHVEGQPIDTYCRDRQMALRARLELFSQVCGAVRFAHRNLVVHGNLEAAKILITAGGMPKVIEFGVADLTSAQPETPGTDLLALGVVLGALLDGCPGLADGVLGEKAAAIQAKAVNSDPALRYPSVEELTAELAACLAPPPAPPEIPALTPAGPVRSGRAWPLRAAAVAALVLLLAAVAGFYYAARIRREHQRFAAQTIEQLSNVPSPSAAMLDVLAQAYWVTGNAAKAVETERRALAMLNDATAGQPGVPLRRQLEENLVRFEKSR